MEKIKLILQQLLELINKYLDEAQAAITVPAAKPAVKATKEVDMFKNKAVLLQAWSQLGEKEIAGAKSNPKIEEYHKYSTIKNLLGMTDDVPWCASFVAWCLEKSNMQSTNSKMARSYEKWGESVKAAPLPGDIVTFYRTSLKSGYGHVGFFLKKEGSFVWVLGGNQSDSVNVTKFSTAKLTDIRRSTKVPIYTEDQIEELHMIANQIIAGTSIAKAGSLT